MKKKLISICLIFSLFQGVGQNTISLYHLGDKTAEISRYNPAVPHESKVFFGIPLLSTYGIASKVPFEIADVLRKDNSGGNLVDLNKLAEGLSRFNKDFNDKTMAMDLDVSLLSFTYRKRNDYTISFFANSKTVISGDLPSSTLAFLAEGWADTPEKSKNFNRLFSDDIKVNVLSYIEAGVGFSRSFLEDDLKVGGNIKALYGVAYGDIGMKLGLQVDRATFNMEVDIKDFQKSGFFSASDKKMFSSLDLGGALDLGVSYNFKTLTNIPFTVSVSALDLGGIYLLDLPSTTGEDKVSIIGEDNFLPLSQKLNDLIYKQILPSSESSVKNKFISLSPRFISSLKYDIMEGFNVNATMFNRIYPTNTINTYALGLTKHLFNDNITLSLNGIKMDGRQPTIGLGTNFRMNGFQFYFGTDNLIDAFNFSKSNNFNVTLGGRFTLGVYKKKVIDRYEDDWQWSEKPKEAFKLLTRKDRKAARKKKKEQEKKWREL